MKRLVSLAAVAVVSLSASAASAASLASTDKFGYTGTITKYSTLADAQAGTNSVATAAVAQRDAALYVHDSETIFMTAWYYTTDPSHGAYSGWGNPNNTNTGFVQLYDTDDSSVTSKSMGWTDASYSTYQVTVSGQNAGASEHARLWYATGTGGAASLTAGTFLNYDLSVTVSGLEGGLSGGQITSTDHPSNVAGYFKGIFQNTSTLDSTVNGFYTFNLTFNNNNWAYDQGTDLNGAFATSDFTAPVPLPASAVGGLVLMGLAALRRSRREVVA